MRLWIVLLLVSTTLAGCAGESEPTSAADPAGPAPKDVEVDDKLGAISGVVVDQTIAPIEGVTVAVLNGPSAVTDSGGSFVIEDLEPGAYFLQTNATGYAAMQISVEVAAGDVAKPRILLQAVAISEPIHYTLKYEGFIQLYPTVAGGVVNILWNDVFGENDPLCKCEFRFTEEAPDVKGFVIEAVWDTNIGNPAGDDTYQLQFSNTDGSGEIVGSIQESPLYTSYGRDLWTPDTTSWRTLLAGNGLFVNVQERYEEFITVWRVEGPPEGWSLVAGDE